MGRRDPGAADQVTRLSGCSWTRAAGAGSFERFSASFRDKLREKLARPEAAVPLREAGSFPNFSARRLLRRATAAAALRALRRARFFRASAAGSATMGGSGGLRFGDVASMASWARPMHHGRVDGGSSRRGDDVGRRKKTSPTPDRDCSGDMTWATNRAASGGRSSPGVDDARPALDVASMASR